MTAPDVSSALPQNSPWFGARPDLAGFGQLVLLITADQKRYLIKLQPGRVLHTHQGIFAHDEIVGRPFGDTAVSQIGHPVLILEPALGDLITHLKRGTQIIYPKDAVYLAYRLNLRAGSRVIEAGTGSGGLTVALAWAVAPAGRIFSYDVHAETLHLARENLTRVGLLPYVELFEHSISAGFLQSEVDALFLDLREPWRFLAQVRAALRPGGFFASLLPTVNQVNELLVALEAGRFVDPAVEELLLRAYKPVPERLRPEDEMVAHTGYLVSARCGAPHLDPAQWIAPERKRYRARLKAEAEYAARMEARAATAEGGRKYPRLPLP